MDLHCYLTKIQGYGTLVILEVKPGHCPKMLISPHIWCSRTDVQLRELAAMDGRNLWHHFDHTLFITFPVR